MLKVGQFVEVVRPLARKSRPQAGVVVGLVNDRRGVTRLVKVYIRTINEVVGVTPAAVKVLECPVAKVDGDYLVTGRGLRISLKTGYPV